jgi:hypothetical protein
MTLPGPVAGRSRNSHRPFRSWLAVLGIADLKTNYSFSPTVRMTGSDTPGPAKSRPRGPPATFLNRRPSDNLATRLTERGCWRALSTPAPTYPAHDHRGVALCRGCISLFDRLAAAICDLQRTAVFTDHLQIRTVRC